MDSLWWQSVLQVLWDVKAVLPASFAVIMFAASLRLLRWTPPRLLQRIVPVRLVCLAAAMYCLATALASGSVVSHAVAVAAISIAYKLCDGTSAFSSLPHLAISLALSTVVLCGACADKDLWVHASEALSSPGAMPVGTTVRIVAPSLETKGFTVAYDEVHIRGIRDVSPKIVLTEGPVVLSGRGTVLRDLTILDQRPQQALPALLLMGDTRLRNVTIVRSKAGPCVGVWNDVHVAGSVVCQSDPAVAGGAEGSQRDLTPAEVAMLIPLHLSAYRQMLLRVPNVVVRTVEGLGFLWTKALQPAAAFTAHYGAAAAELGKVGIGHALELTLDVVQSAACGAEAGYVGESKAEGGQRQFTQVGLLMRCDAHAEPPYPTVHDATKHTVVFLYELGVPLVVAMFTDIFNSEVEEFRFVAGICGEAWGYVAPVAGIAVEAVTRVAPIAGNVAFDSLLSPSFDAFYQLVSLIFHTSVGIQSAVLFMLWDGLFMVVSAVGSLLGACVAFMAHYTETTLSTHLFVCLTSTAFVGIVLWRDVTDFVAKRPQKKMLGFALPRYLTSFPAAVTSTLVRESIPLINFSLIHLVAVLLVFATASLPFSSLHFLSLHVALPLGSTYTTLAFFNREGSRRTLAMSVAVRTVVATVFQKAIGNTVIFAVWEMVWQVVYLVALAVALFVTFIVMSLVKRRQQQTPPSSQGVTTDKGTEAEVSLQ